MYFTTMLLFLSFVSTCHEVESNGVSDDCEKCKIGLVADVEKNIDNLTEKKLLGFLSTFDESCVDNVEFSEYSNTVLFLSLLRQPELIIRLLDTHDEISLKQINKQEISLIKNKSLPLRNYRACLLHYRQPKLKATI